MDNFDLHKAMEEETRLSGPENCDPELSAVVQREFQTMTDSSKMIGLAKAALAKKRELIRDLLAYLNSLDSSDKHSYCSHAGARILSTAKQISILDTIISSNVIGVNSDEETDHILDAIIKLNSL